MSTWNIPMSAQGFSRAPWNQPEYECGCTAPGCPNGTNKEGLCDQCEQEGVELETEEPCPA